MRALLETSLRVMSNQRKRLRSCPALLEISSPPSLHACICNHAHVIMYMHACECDPITRLHRQRWPLT